MCKTKAPRSSSPAAHSIKGIHTACLPGTGGSKVSIRIFDPKGLAGGNVASETQVKQELKAFFDGLAATPNLPPQVVQDLQTFSFEVTYFKESPTGAERNAFGMMDFPLYFDSTTGPGAMTPRGARQFLSSHGIPEETFVRKVIGVDQTKPEPVKPFEQAEEVLKDDNHDELGFGIPGAYDEVKVVQTMCRKVGLIKVNLIKKITVADIREKKFIAAIKHELGHMFGLAHRAGTFMEGKLDDAIRPENASFDVEQVKILRRVLNLLKRS